MIINNEKYTCNSQKLIIIGGGGHCRACIDVIEAEGLYEIAGILDKPENVGNCISGYRIIGTDDDFDKYILLDYHFLIAIGQIGRSTLREKIHDTLKGKGAKLATVISPDAYVSKSTTIGEGTIIMHGCIINSHAVIGEDCTINSKALIEHDTVISDHCHIATGALINGAVFVDESSFCGSGSIVTQGSLVPKYSFIKAGTRFKNDKTAFLTTIFPIEKSYIDKFMQSLVSQRNQSFDLILLNDGYEDISKLQIEYPEINIIEIASEHNIAKNRASLINFARLNGYDYAIFGDIDDYFSPDRVGVLKALLTKKDIIVNDFTTFDSNGVLEPFYLSNRFKNGASLNESDIFEKNIFGFTNTAINLNKIKNIEFSFSENLIAVDWYFFGYLLSRGLTAVFTNDTQTYYRQHSENIIGINGTHENELEKILRVKKAHYREMKKISKKYDIFYQKVSALAELDLNNINNNLTHPLWWEYCICRK